MNVAIVVAAGKGSRMSGTEPKQFIELRGIPIIVHTLKRFEQCTTINKVILVLPAAALAGFQSLATKFSLGKISQVVTGGATRARSVLNGLKAISDAHVVAVHDGVRPFVTPAEIDDVVRSARASGAAVLVAAVADTIKEVSAQSIVRTVPRTSLRRALTPQAFRFDLLKRAYDQLADIESEGIDVTDDSLLVEQLGVKPILVEGSSRNIKITAPEDLELAEAILNRE